MAEYYVSNEKDTEDFYQFVNASDIGGGTAASASDIITDLDFNPTGTLSAGDIIQVNCGGSQETYEVLDFEYNEVDEWWELTVDRNLGVTGWVDIWFDSAQDGTSNNPYVTIGQALAVADNDDVIYIKRNPTEVWPKYALAERDQFKKALVPTGEGDVTTNRIMKIIGYHTSESDMQYGGTYYQSAWEMYRDGVDETKIVRIDGEDGIANLLDLSLKEVITIENIWFMNCTSDAIATLLTHGCKFNHCVFSGTNVIIGGMHYGNEFNDCYFYDIAFSGDIYAFQNEINNSGNRVCNCVIDLSGAAATKAGLALSGAASTLGGNLYFNNLIISGEYPYLGRGGDIVKNNIFYGGDLGMYIDVAATATTIVIEGNIFLMTVSANKGISLVGEGAIRESYNCFWSTENGGEQLDDPIDDGGSPVTLGEGSIEADPLFVDVDGKDFRLQSGSPCFNMGAKMFGGYSSMGVWQQKQGTRRKRVRQ